MNESTQSFGVSKKRSALDNCVLYRNEFYKKKSSLDQKRSMPRTKTKPAILNSKPIVKKKTQVPKSTLTFVSCRADIKNQISLSQESRSF
jgi:hypothetical protein